MNQDFVFSLFEDDMELQQELADLFLQVSPQQLAAVRDAVERRDALALERTAHAIKGSLCNFVALEAYHAAQHLESIGREGDLSQAGEAYQVMERQLISLRSTLADFQMEYVS